MLTPVDIGIVRTRSVDALAGGVETQIGARHRNAKEIHAQIERRLPGFGRLQVAEHEDAAKEQRQLVAAALEIEVEIVDPEDRQRKRERRIDRHAHGQGLARRS